jgi:hypothetical protein
MSEMGDFTFFGYHVVCLIDVLGQKQELARWGNLPQDGQITPDFINAIKRTGGTVLVFRDQFIKLFEGMGRCANPDKLAVLPEEQQERYRRFKECKVLVERFSDSFVFSSLIPNTYGDASVTPLYRVLGACCHAMIVSLEAKVPVRGAITVGAGCVLPDGSFYGPALAEAHSLESEVANYPRVVMSPTVLAFLADGETYSADPQVAQIMARVAGMCRAFVWQDVDGCWAVDFLGKGVRDVFGTETGLSVAVKMAYEFTRAQARHWRQSGNTKLALRYHLLQQYMHPRLPLWGIQADE